MGAKRLVLTMVVLGGAAGAALALATVPSFSPYREREARTRHDDYGTVAEADADDALGPDRYAYVPGGGEDRRDGFGIAPGPREGTIILELPRWAESAGSWFAFGQRALDEWGFDADSDDAGGWHDEERPRRYADRGQDGGRVYGYAPHGLDRDVDGPGEAYALPQTGRSRWADPEEEQALGAEPARPGALVGRGGPATQDSAADDAAADAAARAREAARDVRAAEGAVQ